MAWIKIPVTEMVLTQRAEQLGLEVVPMSLFVNKYEQKPALFLGLAGCNASEIKRGPAVGNNGEFPPPTVCSPGSRLWGEQIGAIEPS